MNVKVFNLALGVNKARFFLRNELCECECTLNQSVCSLKQKWNRAECWCECKELDDWGSCKNDFMQNHRTCDCELNKICKVDEYLDIKNCSCENRLFSKLTLECEDEILNAMETIIEDKNVSCEKN